jgi:hypothetical protein
MKSLYRLIPGMMILLTVFTLLGTSCNKENLKSYSISGKAQKGPFVTGASVTINELNSNLEQTGKSFSTTIAADDGSFSLNSVELASNIALVTVNGYYYDEHLNIVQNGVLNLQALTDISGKTAININALTHVLKDRVEVLFKTGLSFDDANKQAQNELILDFFDISEANTTDFDQMDISATGSDNALLLAFSAMMLRRTGAGNDPSVLTELLTKLRTDFKDDGEINNPDLRKQIWDNVRFLNPAHIQKNLKEKYQQIGINVNLSDFQYYINKYVEKHAPTLYNDIQYPPTSVLASHFYSEGVDAINFLDKNLTVINTVADRPEDMVFAAITPLNKTLKIRILPANSQMLFSCNNGSYPIDLESGGWLVETNKPEEIIISTQRQNLLVSFRLERCLLPQDQVGFYAPVTIEYYEDGTSVPTFTKTVTFVH